MTGEANKPVRVLVVDDDKNLRFVLTTELAEEGFTVEATDDGALALEMVRGQEFDVMLLDLNMPTLGGLEVLRKVRESECLTEIVVLTGHGTISTAVEAMKLGAYDFFTKPFKIEEVAAVIEKAAEKRQLVSENLRLKDQIRREEDKWQIVTGSPLMEATLAAAGKVAATEFTVLILGESGVGKELVARHVHRLSGRADGPFIPINCGAIPENMLESELFGYEKGAFTGAQAKKMGLLEIAGNGTLFLDEIGEMSTKLQGKLLRVIETGAFFRLGGTREVTVSVRFVSATNKNIGEEVREGRFRQDLYYRVGAMTIRVPPLRERKEDIPLLVEHFRERLPDFRAKVFGRKVLDLFREYPWPGNVRELQNVVHRTLLLSPEDVIDHVDLTTDLAAGPRKEMRLLEEIEKAHVLKVFQEEDGHKGRTASVLGIDPKTLYRKLKDYGIGE